jgi:hypothetical protein
MYDFNFRQTVKRLLPTFLRGVFWAAFIERLLTIPRILHQAAYLLYSQQRYELPFTGQILSLETRLNQFYGSLASAIYIQTVGNTIAALYIFTQNENRLPNYCYFSAEGQPARYIYTENELISDVDFIVFIPNTIIYNPAQVEAIVNMYKLAGKRFKIENY